MFRTRLLVELDALCEDRLIVAAMTLIGAHELQIAVFVLWHKPGPERIFR
jgi:hypothetical protein